MSEAAPETTPAPAPETPATTEASTEEPKQTTSIFGSTAGTTSNIFSAAPAFGSAPAKPAAGQEEEEGDAGADDKHAADFKPLVSLPKVEVKTQEEDEEVIYKCRCKLFVFVKEDVYGGEKRENFWKERGTGDVKLLKHKEFGKVRLLMRQEKTLKICANHLVSPHLEVKPNVGSDRSWVFSANDFAEEVLKAEMFAIKFGKAEFANEFKDKLEEAKKINSEESSDDKKEETTEATEKEGDKKEDAGEKLAEDVEKLNVKSTDE